MDDTKAGVSHRGRLTGGSDAMEGSAAIILVSSELGGEVGVRRANGGRAQGRSICGVEEGFQRGEGVSRRERRKSRRRRQMQRRGWDGQQGGLGPNRVGGRG